MKTDEQHIKTHRRQIEFQLSFISDHKGELSESDLEWAIKMEEAYERQGFLTENQRAVLDRIWEKL